jgi:outer membrane murein-binding lipoprotein Lpp
MLQRGLSLRLRINSNPSTKMGFLLGLNLVFVWGKIKIILFIPKQRRVMRKIGLILLCLLLAGCVSSPKSKILEQQVNDLQTSLSEKDAQILKLQGLLTEKEQQLKEKDSKIEELKNKLTGFGVF